MSKAGCYHRRMAREGETERLLLRPLELADAAQIQEIFPHWEVVRYLINRVPWPYPADGALVFLRDVALPAIARENQWTWTLRLKQEPDRVIGAVDLRRGDEDNRGFWLGVGWQRQGLMSEACAWVNDYWFDVLGFWLLRVAKATDNVASRRISERQGMRLVGTKEKDYVCGRLSTGIWEITADEWRSWKAGTKAVTKV